MKELISSGWIRGTYDTDPTVIEHEDPSRYVAIDTAVAYRSEFLVRQLLSINPNSKVFTKIAPCMVDQYEELMETHLALMGVDKVHCVYIHNEIGTPDQISKLLGKLNRDPRVEYVGLSNFHHRLRSNDDIHKLKYATFQWNAYQPDEDAKAIAESYKLIMNGWGPLGGKYRASKYLSQMTYFGALAFNMANDINPIINPTENDFYVLDNFSDYGVIECNKLAAIRLDSPFEFNPNKYKYPPTSLDINGTSNFSLGNLVPSSIAHTKSEYIDITESEVKNYNWLSEVTQLMETRYVRTHYSINRTIDTFMISDSLLGVVQMIDKDGHLTKVVKDAKQIRLCLVQL